MTTDDFTTAARAEAKRRWEFIQFDSYVHAAEENGKLHGFENGAEWARDHLAAQEPTDAEVEAAALGELAHLQGYYLADQEDRAEVLAWWNEMDESGRNSRLATARAVIAAARAVGRDAR